MRDSLRRHTRPASPRAAWELNGSHGNSTEVNGSQRKSTEVMGTQRKSWELKFDARVFACVFVTELSSTPSGQFPTKVACTPSWPGAGHTLRVTSSASNEVTSSS